MYYECVTEWIQTTGGNSGFSNYSSSLIEVLLSNITPHKANILAVFYIKIYSTKITN